MKARTQIVKHKDVEREVEKEIKRQSTEFATSLTQQMYALMCFTLAKQFGWGAKRMKLLIDGIESDQNFLSKGFCGSSADNLDVIKYIDERYHLDISGIKVNLDWKDR